MNSTLDQLQPSLLRAVHQRKRPGDVDLGLGEPVLPVERSAFQAAMAWVETNGLPYSPNPGFLTLRQAIVDHYNYPYHRHAEQVVVTIGSEESVYLALRTAVDPGEGEVLVVEPAYPVYTKICQLEGIPVRTVSLSEAEGFVPTAERVLEQLSPRTQLLVLCSPCNPTGRVWSREELVKLVAGLEARPGKPVQVLFDEVYRELVYGDAPFCSLAELYPHTWVCNSLSKSHALTGLRIGWLMAPSVHAGHQANKVHHLIVTSPGTFGQQVALSLFQQPASFQAHHQVYATRRAAILDILQAARLTHLPPDGAFYVMVKLPGDASADSVQTSFDLVDHARVVTIPGRAFGDPLEGWLRLSWVGAPEVFGQGIQRILEWVDRRR